jgi:proteasome activator subunit 4
MSELQDSAEVQQYSSGVLYIMAAINPPADLTEPLTEIFLGAVKASPVRTTPHSLSILFLMHSF